MTRRARISFFLAAALALADGARSVAAPAKKPSAQPAVAAATTRPDPKKALAGLGALVEKALADQKIPGAAVAVVVGDEVVLLEGYGLRDVAGKLPMTPDTLIPIASVTKQFTVGALGTLVRRGKLEWDKPIRDYLPEFRLHDDYATLRATPRDLVTHRIGLPRHDGAWFGSSLSREELYGKLRYFPFSRDIRTRFQYNNFMYMTAGLLGGRVAGTTWEGLVKSALFEPLGMARSGFSLKELAKDADHATGYQLDDARKVVPDPFESAEAMGPTGSINSTARELSNWVRMLLSGGTWAGRQVLQKADVEAMMQPQMPIGPALFSEIGYRSYGMGLFVETYRGHAVAQHGGNMPGAAAMVLMVPKERIGVVVLTNRSAAVLRDGLPYEIVDRLLGLPSAGLVARWAELEAKDFAGQDAAKSAGASDRVPNTTPSHALEAYVGRYSDPGYGALDVTLRDGALALTYNGFSARLDHWHYDVFQTPEDRTSRLDRERIQFQSDLQGEISAVAYAAEPNVAPIVFLRQPPPELTDPAFLKRFVGTYEVGGLDLEVVLREDGILQTVQLGRVRDLAPVRGTLFRIKELTGVSVEFLSDKDGRIDRIAIHSGGSVIGPRKK